LSQQDKNWNNWLFEEKNSDPEKADLTQPDPCSKNVTQPDLEQNILAQTHIYFL